MQTIKTSLAIVATALLGACATQPPADPGRHMVLRDMTGKLVMQFDYPTDELCAKTTAAMRGSAYKANCATTSSAEPLRGHATLRYTPPGVLVQAHYTDLGTCRSMTTTLSAGVEMIQACRAK